MNCARVEKIANAVLYEGYMLYPYRASAIKNQQRFNFGVLYPQAWCERQSGPDSSVMRTEYLLEGALPATVEVKTRFLQMIEREGRQEGVEREASIAPVSVESLIQAAAGVAFEFDSVSGEVGLSASAIAHHTYKLRLRVSNTAALDSPELSRERVLLRSMVSTHSILHVSGGGQFVSLLDPPQCLAEAAALCQNSGAWPVLAGDDGQRDLMLASPIILYDYPQVAPESPGDLYDGGEIDEILALRILTMTDAEKAEIRAGDSRAREILERTELLPAEQFQKLHGALRAIRPVTSSSEPHNE